VCVFFVGTGRFEDLNATVQWTSACRQLDGGNSLIFRSIGTKNATNLAGTFPKGNQYNLHRLIHFGWM